MRPTVRPAVLASVGLLLAACGSRFAPPPLSVQVVDAGTGRPLAGVPVLYGLETVHCRRLLPSELETRWARTVSGITDARGEARVAVGEVALDFDECVFREALLVNVDVDLAGERGRQDVEILESFCRAFPGSWSCKRPVSEHAVAHLAESDACGAGVLSPRSKGHGGRQVLLAPPGRYAPSDLAHSCGGWLRTTLHESSRSSAEIVAVRLAPPER